MAYKVLCTTIRYQSNVHVQYTCMSPGSVLYMNMYIVHVPVHLNILVQIACGNLIAKISCIHAHACFILQCFILNLSGIHTINSENVF